LIACACFGKACHADQPVFIRVAIIQDAASLRLGIRGFYEVIDAKTNSIIYRGKDIFTTVTSYKSGILLGSVKSNSDKVSIVASDADAISINGRRFRGAIQFIKKSNGKILVINNIELEDYIRGILYHEASHYWPIEALKAQAVCSRTYALYQRQQNLSKDFDVTSDIYSQVYGGKTSERARTNRAVEDTKTLALKYQDKIFPAYFHATCAGFTEDASELWNIDLKPLKGTSCPFCRESPHFSWYESLPLDELEKKLNAAGHKVSGITGIYVAGRNRSGRATAIKFVSKNKEFQLPAKEFRSIIGPNSLKSTNFNVSVVKGSAVFVGVGWGHGAGLCQWGAYFMAKEGRKFDEILKYYYPGADVKSY